MFNNNWDIAGIRNSKFACKYAERIALPVKIGMETESILKRFTESDDGILPLRYTDNKLSDRKNIQMPRIVPPIKNNQKEKLENLSACSSDIFLFALKAGIK